MTILKNAALNVCDAAFGFSERPLSVNDLQGLFHTHAGVPDARETQAQT
jgi:hypothetical protein